MRFRLATDNGQSGGKLAQGIGSIFNALAMAPLYRAQGQEAFQTAEQKRELMQSQIGENLARTAVENEKGKLLAGRPDILNLMGATRAGMSVPEFQAGINERTHGAPAVGPALLPQPIEGVGPSGRTAAFDDAILTLFGPAMATPAANTNWDQIAQARGHYQDQGVLDQAVAAAVGGDYMKSGALSAVRGKKEFTPFAAVGNTGTALNQVTGAQPVSNPGLNVLFGNKVGSEIDENKAQAGSANASAGAARALAGLRGVQTSNEKVKGGITALDLQAAKEGKPLPSSNKGTSGSSATNSKFRNQVIMAAMRSDFYKSLDPNQKQDFINSELEAAGLEPIVPGELAKAPGQGAGAPPAHASGNQPPPDGTRGTMNGVHGTVRNGKFVPDQAQPPSKPSSESKVPVSSAAPAASRPLPRSFAEIPGVYDSSIQVKTLAELLGNPQVAMKNR